MILARMRSPFRLLSRCSGVYSGNASLAKALRLGSFPRWPVCCRAYLAVRAGRFLFFLASVISPVRGGVFRAAILYWLYRLGQSAGLAVRQAAFVAAPVVAESGVAIHHFAPLRIWFGNRRTACLTRECEQSNLPA